MKAVGAPQGQQDLPAQLDRLDRKDLLVRLDKMVNPAPLGQQDLPAQLDRLDRKDLLVRLDKMVNPAPLGLKDRQGHKDLLDPRVFLVMACRVLRLIGQTFSMKCHLTNIYALGLQVFGSNYVLGTGFRAHYTDVIWTNAHVIRGINDAINSLTTTNWRVFATKSGTRIGSLNTTYYPTLYIEHPNYDGSTASPDVALIFVEETARVPRFLPRQYAVNLRVGQPIATIGFPGEIAETYSIVPIATFKDGTISALRPFLIGASPTPFNSSFVQHNLDLSGGTSGSPIFDHLGWIIAVNNSGTENLVFDVNTGQPQRIPTGNIGFGIRVDEVWRFIDHLESLAPSARINANNGTRRARAILADRDYPYDSYQPFPSNWNSETIEP